MATETRALHVKNLRGLTTVELDEKTKDLKKELFNLRFQFMAGRVENPAKMKQTRREIARVKTILREKQKGEKGQAAGQGT
jgi:large subunit ribosomal protein L29